MDIIGKGGVEQVMWLDVLVLAFGLALIVFAFGVVMVYERSTRRRDLYQLRMLRECDESEHRAVARELLESRRTFRRLDGEIKRFLEGVEKR